MALGVFFGGFAFRLGIMAGPERFIISALILAGFGVLFLTSSLFVAQRNQRERIACGRSRRRGIRGARR